ncbi:MAG TPA: cysteine--tRNA ligase [bacterium]|nr:cysteine--tRNA ligase [bacterium]HQG46105.1 cysteine--tRNA ligase [bacterium]HQI48848.1 cysteine--tRNA ligase [bacterium]HQJ66027.1 cysteine--tRNA ligase [bacterium]
MPLTVYNSLTRSKELFEPITPGRVTMYVCGPTVYDNPHIGHVKSYVSFDVIVRYLRFLGYKVRYVQNITDVGHLLDSGEDRILRGAEREQLQPMELVERYTRAYFAAMDALNVLRPDISPRASGHVPEQIELVQKLIEKGMAYVVNGSVYFDVGKFPAYGKLSGRKVEEQMAGARLNVIEEKRHPADFALWKKAEPEHIMQWNSPWGRGFPGWHIECSAMSMKYLGESIDIHGGGMENQFPHHECEIAQSEAATGKRFVKYWLHNNMVLVDGIKMSKSLGNFTTVEQALGKFSGEQVRFFILQSHYRSPVDFSDAAITAAGQGLERLRTTLAAVRRRAAERGGTADAAAVAAATPSNSGSATASEAAAALIDTYRNRFLEAMDDDFNTPAAIGHLFDFCREINKHLDVGGSPADAQLFGATLTSLAGEVLGLRLQQEESGGVEAAPFIELLLKLRAALRQKREFQMADQVRDQLQELGVVIEDGKEGTRWKVMR